ncbi:hypothetical protein LSTR_LSTR010402 [Laodelphax striatellus]|uniref:Secreted protein n=1 Tax=Laodelphax striatellus TaxID=195883 RepID=A0A482WT66_LAOST|nr:hypothetical protein LSTR_LSTR010402 [Laodelphax striatellus]
MKIASLLLFRWLLGSDCKMEMNSTKINATGDKPETDRRERESVRVRKKGCERQSRSLPGICVPSARNSWGRRQPTSTCKRGDQVPNEVRLLRGKLPKSNFIPDGEESDL